MLAYYWLCSKRKKKKSLSILDVGKARKRRSQSSEVCLWKFRAKEEGQIYTSLRSWGRDHFQIHRKNRLWVKLHNLPLGSVYGHNRCATASSSQGHLKNRGRSKVLSEWNEEAQRVNPCALKMWPADPRSSYQCGFGHLWEPCQTGWGSQREEHVEW